ncbi:hypothetical protein KKE99_02740, partial [Patescibacteria group bacterium]|nr:hypothetical protein [Patescibacteria group bacterium]
AIISAAAYYFFFLNKNNAEPIAPKNNSNVSKTENVIDKNLDTDQDKLPDYLEKILGTDENNSDTDGDGYDDLVEIKNGYDPLNGEKYSAEEWQAVKEKIRNENEEFFNIKFEVYNTYPKSEVRLETFLCGSSTVSDVDNNIYNTVKIGGQCWLKQNLKVTKNPQGKPIDRDCYDNDPDICNMDGGLYTWLATMNIIISDISTFKSYIQAKEPAQGICPDGWHIPRDSEWSTLENYLEENKAKTVSGSFMLCSGADGYWIGCGSAGIKLRQGGSSGFEAVYAGAVENSHSPVALPNEFWYQEYLYKTNWEDTDSASKFNFRGESAYFWSSTSLPPRTPQDYPNTRLYEAWFRKLSSVHGGTLKDDAVKNRGGKSVRCLKD